VRLGEAPCLFVTGQHRSLDLRDYRLDGFPRLSVQCPGLPDPALHSAWVAAELAHCLRRVRPNLLLVQGDTSSALGGALAAREAGVAVGHVEAGLRSHDPRQPWPEEENRVRIDRISHLLFAPTEGNAQNLRREGLAGAVAVTGNTGIDALFQSTKRLGRRRRGTRNARRFKLLVTCHRRENWGSGLERVMEAVALLASDGAEIDVLLPPNASVAQHMLRLTRQRANVRLLPDLSHPAMVSAVLDADLILSDSGGLQEEAPTLGIPLLVLREKTERPEAVQSGAATLVGTDVRKIVREARRIRAEPPPAGPPAMLFGDGRASERIARLCLDHLQREASGGFAREPID
jgi:UDP-N-acetylglucosamine 2-epimerase (non-hydrolysing)